MKEKHKPQSGKSEHSFFLLPFSSKADVEAADRVKNHPPLVRVSIRGGAAVNLVPELWER